MLVTRQKTFLRGHFDAQVSQMFMQKNKNVQENEYKECL